MIPLAELWIFIIAAFALVITPGPNMLYLISRSITQGKKAGLISLVGVVLGFLFHALMVSFGLTAIFMAIPYAFLVLKTLGVGYLLWLAFQAVRPSGKSIFEARTDLKPDKPGKLFTMGFLTNVLNPKIAVFYLSFFPQFIKPEQGTVLAQSLELALVQMSISFSINFIIVLSAARLSLWFNKNPSWLKMQKWFMASVLTGLAVKMAFTKVK
ncbi:LysE family translocator [Pseudobacter ginsenosidimutans]|uniref:Threonine/homoserine/homoserine lactone efflux protein n=1 Tax=Pseudobacter ginsenosidimutans TaxID=661488 RepID=A0A4Q7N4X6_9BACT|nr:LysE family translocator [Pseudobacter ginsenosidimutans]QEC44615.1 LysE family translocator [Pseudobacter ginsenosidimutans]RZS76093.1 threonine/homoserine/homoserine lactone efflux protein [Pseudobacter ginsenosidimutans]